MSADRIDVLAARVERAAANAIRKPAVNVYHYCDDTSWNSGAPRRVAADLLRDARARGLTVRSERRGHQRVHTIVRHVDPCGFEATTRVHTAFARVGGVA